MKHKLHQKASTPRKALCNIQRRLSALFLLLMLLYGLSQNVSAQINFNTKVDFITGTRPYGIAVGDLDGDGKLDLAVANHFSGTVSVLRNTSTSGTISFATKVDFATGLTSWSVAIGDLDGDGKLDLAVTNYNNQTVSVLRNTSTSGTISFATKVDFAVMINPTGIVMGDLDGDLKLDLAITITEYSKLSVLRNLSTSGTISFAPKVDFPAGYNAYDLTTGDVDGDGKLDIAVVNANVNTVSVFRNLSTSGTISFAPKVDFPTGFNPNGVTMGDLDGDGKPDLVIANSTTASNTVWVQRNTSTSGTVSFAPKVDFITGVQPHGLVIGDLDGDGKPDLTVTNSSSNSNTVSVLQNTSTSGTISFAPKVDFGVGTESYRVAIGDVDGDGKPDLAVTNYGSNTVSVLRNSRVSVDSCVTPPAGMVGWWPLDETSGTTVADIVGGFNGTALPGPIGTEPGPGPVPSNLWPPPPFPPGMVNTSLFFGAGRHIKVPSASALDPGTGDFTIDAWFVWGGGTGPIVQKMLPNFPGYRLNIYMDTQQGGGLSFEAGGSPSGGSALNYFPITRNQWHHVAGTIQRGSPDVIRLYLDGAPVVETANQAFPPGATIGTNVDLLIGGDGQTPGARIAVDEVEIFNRALDSLEVRSIWAADSLGKCKPPALLGSLCGFKFNDVNGNCVMDSLEQVLPGWTINLSGPVNLSTTTNSLGQYCFGELPAGTYTVSEVLQSGWIQTCPPSPGTYVQTISGQNINNLNFGNRIDTVTVGSLCGFKFNDVNSNCIKDSLEQGLPGWTINLSGSGLSLSTTTNSLGQYCFTSLPAGTYTVSEVLQTGWIQTCPAPPGTYTVNLSAGQQVTGIIFGNRGAQDTCLGNIIQNWSFINGAVPGAMPLYGQTSNWTSAYCSPDVAVFGGCGDSAYVGMWGNQVVGEAIQQTLANPLVQGVTYAIDFCARWSPVPGQPYPVHFAFRASNVSLTSPQDPNGVIIGVSQAITQQNWVTVTLPNWLATGAFPILTISATNQSSFNHGDSTSYGHIDRICIRRTPTGVAEDRDVPSGFALLQSYPNPFNPTTTIEYQVPVTVFVKLNVFDILGREIAILVNENRSVGKYSVTFDTSNLPAGIYFYRMQAGEFQETRKLVLLK